MGVLRGGNVMQGGRVEALANILEGLIELGALREQLNTLRFARYHADMTAEDGALGYDTAPSGIQLATQLRLTDFPEHSGAVFSLPLGARALGALLEVTTPFAKDAAYPTVTAGLFINRRKQVEDPATYANIVLVPNATAYNAEPWGSVGRKTMPIDFTAANVKDMPDFPSAGVHDDKTNENAGAEVRFIVDAADDSQPALTAGMFDLYLMYVEVQNPAWARSPGVGPFTIWDVPEDGVTLANIISPGGIAIDATNAVAYINVGTQASPEYKAITTEP